MKTKTITSKYNINYDETQVGLATPGTAAKITTFQRNRVSKRKYALRGGQRPVSRPAEYSTVYDGILDDVTFSNRQHILLKHLHIIFCDW